MIMVNQTLYLLDNSTARITDLDTVDSVGPTDTRTFTISESLDESRNYTAIVSSDLDDETVWTWVGQFM